MAKPRGLSVRLKLTLSYAGFLMLAGGLALAGAGVFLARYAPDSALFDTGGVLPDGSVLLRGTPIEVLKIAAKMTFTLSSAVAPAVASALAFLLLFGLVGGWLLAGRMLGPLSRITDATRLAASGSLSHRIRLQGRRDEFRELADAFDTMLARLEAHVAEQRRFAANASHELRTPLAITRTLLDVARDDPTPDTSQLVERLHAVNTRAIDLTEALLVLSRADQRSFTREPIDLALVTEEATETLLPLAEKRDVRIETSGDAAVTIGSPTLLLQLSTNLVHNAIVHNLPEHGSVWVRTSVQPNGVVLTVENTGERLAPEVVSTLVEPFLRGTGRTAVDHAGAGLGLAIVKSITEAHDGTLTLTPRPAGGLHATVQLPVTARMPAVRSRAPLPDLAFEELNEVTALGGFQLGNHRITLDGI